MPGNLLGVLYFLKYLKRP